MLADINKAYRTSLLKPTRENIDLCAKNLIKGELVAFPTETVYGLGADGLNELAVKKIFEAKGRPHDNPLILHVADIKESYELAYVDDMAKDLMKAFWPGPLTLLLPKKSIVPHMTTAGLDTVALRMPDHDVAIRLIKAFGGPLAAPSANRSGRPSPTRAEHVLEDLDGRISAILEGGICDIGLESTVLDISSRPVQILRPGAITYEMLLPYCKDIVINSAVLAPLSPKNPVLSPGLAHRHYAPKGLLTLVEGSDKNVISKCKKLYDEAISSYKKAAIFSFSERKNYYEDRYVIDMGSLKNTGQIATKLFACLRQMDKEGVEYILSEVMPPQGLGLAIMNRLGRAADFRIIYADV